MEIRHSSASDMMIRILMKCCLNKHFSNSANRKLKWKIRTEKYLFVFTISMYFVLTFKIFLILYNGETLPQIKNSIIS